MKGNNGRAEGYALFKKPGKSFGWQKISFNDEEGVQVCGLWYAPMEMSPSHDVQPPQSLDRIKRLARMSGLAIPLRFMLGNDGPNANKYCVLTNWWRERNAKELYLLPTLDFDRYEDPNQE